MCSNTRKLAFAALWLNRVCQLSFNGLG